MATDVQPFEERRWTARDGLSLYARDYPGGPGPARLPVICLHGLTRNSRDFEDVAPLIAATGRRVITADMRGRGQSDRDPDPAHYQPKVYVRDVTALMDALGIGRAVFLGTSMGGIITMVLAGVRPKSIAAAILNDVGPEVGTAGIERIKSYVGSSTDVRSWADAADYMRAINGVAFPQYGEEDWLRFARRTFRDLNGRPELDYDPAIALQLRQGNYKAATFLAWMLFKRLGRRVPILLVRGANSDLLTAETAAKMKRAVPSMQLTEVPGVGHAPMLTEEPAINAIRDFLEKVD